MNRIGHILLLIFSSFTIQGQTITIQDTTVMRVLISTLCVDTDGNGSPDQDVDTNDDLQIQVSEALTVRRLNIRQGVEVKIFGKKGTDINS